MFQRFRRALRENPSYCFVMSLFYFILIILIIQILLFVVKIVNANDLASRVKSVTLYNNSGQIVSQWTGLYSVQQNKNEVRIETPDKTTLIYGGIVVVEVEKAE